MLQYNVFGILGYKMYSTLILFANSGMGEKLPMAKNEICDDKGKSLINILLVDHDGLFLRITKRCLTIETSFKIETALSIEEALIKLREKKIDVIVSEIMSPDVKRFEFLKTFLNEDKTTPIIVFTIEDEPNLAAEALKTGASGFVAKVGDPSLVFSTLKNCIESAYAQELNSPDKKRPEGR